MNDQEIFKKIGVIISELSSQYNYLSENPGSLNEFELELLRANGKFLTEHIEILQRLAVSRKVPVAAQSPAKMAPDEQKQDTPLPAGSPEPKPPEPVQQDAEETAPAEPAPETMQDDPATNPEPAPAEPEPVIHEVTISERTVAIDVPAAETPEQDRVPTVRDQIAAAMGSPATVARSLGQQPVGDLKSAISLNDKLLFVKELFGGYSLAYNEAIELANRSASFEAAKNFLQVNYAAKNNWESRPATVEKLHELLKRRFEG